MALIRLEKIHDNLTGKDKFYVRITSDKTWAMRNEWFDCLSDAEEYYQKAIDNKCIGSETTMIKEVTI